MGNNKKVYENCKVEYDEEFGSVHVYTNEKTLYLYTKTDGDREKVNKYDTLGATAEFLSGVIGFMIPLVAFGCLYMKEIISSSGISFGFILIALFASLICIVVGIIFLVPLAMALIHGCNLDRAYRNKEHWKIFLASFVFLILTILFICIDKPYD